MLHTHSLFRSVSSRVLLVVLGLSTASACGDVARSGRAPAFLIIESLDGASGASDSGTFSTVVRSDVQAIVPAAGDTPAFATIYNDNGRATFRLGLKNPGSVTAPLAPTTLNEITITRYRVTFRRTDGRNTPGVDVPWAFEGGVTVTVPATGTAQVIFDLVRHTSKSEPPLINLRGLGAGRFINTVADVQFFGHDQAGNDVTAMGQLTVNFADFGD